MREARRRMPDLIAVRMRRRNEKRGLRGGFPSLNHDVFQWIEVRFGMNSFCRSTASLIAHRTTRMQAFAAAGPEMETAEIAPVGGRAFPTPNCSAFEPTTGLAPADRNCDAWHQRIRPGVGGGCRRRRVFHRHAASRRAERWPDHTFRKPVNTSRQSEVVISAPSGYAPER